MDPMESSSSSFPVLSTESSAALQRNSIWTITSDAEQHDPDLLNAVNIQSGGSPDTRLNKFQSDPSRSKAFTSDGRDSPTTTPSLGLLNFPSDLLPIVTDTGLPTISSEAPHNPSVLTAVDDKLSEIDMDTVSPLDWIMTPESDRSLGTVWNALSATDTLPLRFAPTTTAAPLVETLPAPEKDIAVAIQTGWSSHDQGDSLDQETGSAPHIGPVEDPSQLHRTLYTYRLSHKQPATSTPTRAAGVSSRTWQEFSETRTTAKPPITPLFSGHDQMVCNEGCLNAITAEETVLISSSTPTVLIVHDGGGFVPHPSNMPSSRSRNFAKTEEICDSGLSGTTPARSVEENRTTSTSINMAPENPAVTTNTPTVPHRPERRPSTTTTTDTATSSVNTDSLLDQRQRARLISRQNVGVATGTVFAGATVFILTFVLHRFVYWWVGKRRTGGREPNTNTGLRIELRPPRSQNPEVSYFSDSS